MCAESLENNVNVDQQTLGAAAPPNRNIWGRVLRLKRTRSEWYNRVFPREITLTNCHFDSCEFHVMTERNNIRALFIVHV